MQFQEPTLTLKYGSGVEADSSDREALQSRRGTDAAMPGWDAVLAAYPMFAPAECVFVSGSLTQGWGHANSDLDLFVVSREAIDVNDDRVEFFQERISTEDPVVWLAIGEVAQFRADIELWRSGQLEELLGRFEGVTRDQEGAELDRTEKELLYRLSVGVPLHGSKRWQEWRDRLQASSYGVWLAENRKLGCEGMLEDTSGMLLSGDVESAALAGREGYVMALEAILAAAGDFSSSRKWLYRRLEGQPLAAAPVNEAWRVLTMEGFHDDPEAWIRATAAGAHRLLLSIETGVAL